MVECNGQGQVEVLAMIEAINQNELDIAVLGGGNVALEARVTQNEDDIVAHNSRIVTLENQDFAGLQIQANENTANIAINDGLIATNVADILTNATDISNIAPVVVQNEADIITNRNLIDLNITSIDTQALEIVDHEARIVALENSAGLATACLLVHETSPGVDGGTSVLGAWTPRNIQTERYNTLGAVVGATSVTLATGTYKIEAFAVVNGSAHQSRINIGGLEFLYGTCLNSDGQSFAMGKFTIGAPTVVTLETNVTVAVPNIGFGEASTFSAPNVYTSMHIDKVG